LYHVAVHALAQRVLSHIRCTELLHAGDRVGVAVSGGIDSVALLRVLLELRGELGIVLSVVHFNHKLRGAESEADQEFVAGLARAHDLEFHVDGEDVGLHAAEERVSVEAAARELRYGFFQYLLGSDAGSLGGEAPVPTGSANRSDGSAAPPKSGPQGLKPSSDQPHNGTTEVVPFPILNGARSRVLNKIATGHTLDDQAETVLMRMIRGSGVTGLGGIHPRLLVEDDDGEICGEIVRPLIGVRRRELESYLREIGQSWREDSSNTDSAFTRNRLRRLVVPLLEKEFNPAVAESLAELAEIARGEEDYWENEAAGWMGTTVHWSEPEWVRATSRTTGLVQISSASPGEGQNPRPVAKDATRAGHPGHDDLESRIDGAPWLVMNASVSRMWLLGEPVAVQRRVVKAIGEQAGIPLEFKHVEETLRFAAEEGAAGKELSLPLGWRVRREAEELVFVTPDLRTVTPDLRTLDPQTPDLLNQELREDRNAAADYEYELSVPGRVAVAEAGIVIEAKWIASVAEEAGYNPEHLLDAESLPRLLRVRNWRPGDRFWPAHTKSPKKIKELLQEQHVAQPERRSWPLILVRNESGDEIVWVRGLRTSAKSQPKPGHAAIRIIFEPIVDEPIVDEPLRTNY
jgi:tRNA(Ile)-lysidine synthase